MYLMLQELTGDQITCKIDGGREKTLQKKKVVRCERTVRKLL